MGREGARGGYGGGMEGERWGYRIITGCQQCPVLRQTSPIGCNVKLQSIPQQVLFRTSRSRLMFRPPASPAKTTVLLDEVGVLPNTGVVLWLVNTLIVDDDPLVGLTLRHFVEKAGGRAACTHVTDGTAALRALA